MHFNKSEETLGTRAKRSTCHCLGIQHMSVNNKECVLTSDHCSFSKHFKTLSMLKFCPEFEESELLRLQAMCFSGLHNSHRDFC